MAFFLWVLQKCHKLLHFIQWQTPIPIATKSYVRFHSKCRCVCARAHAILFLRDEVLKCNLFVLNAMWHIDEQIKWSREKKRKNRITKCMCREEEKQNKQNERFELAGQNQCMERNRHTFSSSKKIRRLAALTEKKPANSRWRIGIKKHQTENISKNTEWNEKMCYSKIYLKKSIP